MNSRRYPRTLEEAFGPYERGPVHPMPDTTHPAERWYLPLLIVVVVLLAAGYL